MSWLKVSAAAGALAAQITTTMAADMPNTLPPPRYLSPIVEPQARLVDPGYGWYVRGDLGYALGRIGSAQSATGFPNPTDSSFGNGFLAGLGAGIKTKWLRTDITYDYTTAMKYQGTIVTPGDVSAKITAMSALLNGYIDLGTWYRMTPYIGAGAGVAMLYTSDFASTVTPPFTGGLSTAQSNFAWAGMAGVGFSISPNLMVDLSYRYINLGDTKSGADASGQMTFKNLAAHQVRVGLRWSFF